MAERPLIGGWPAQEARRAPHGMIASVKPLASAAGLRVLHNGGNAMDAAIAAEAVPRAVFFPDGRPAGAGFNLWQPELARTLRTIHAEGAAAYRGPIA